MPERIAFSDIVCAATRNFITSGKPTYRYWAPVAAARRGFKMVLFTASRGNTFVGGTCALPSALLVLLAINYTGVQPHTVKLWTMDARRRVGCPFHQMGWVLGWGHADSWNFDIFWKFEMACFGASCVAFFVKTCRISQQKLDIDTLLLIIIIIITITIIIII